MSEHDDPTTTLTEETVTRTPVFRHDCDTCTFLGTNLDERNGFRRVDVWVHPHTVDGESATVILRDGDDGPSYESGPAILKVSRAAREALTAGIDDGLVDNDTQADLFRKLLYSL
jgi:hypothetical protein